MKIIFATASKYKIQLLEKLNLKFSAISSDINEDHIQNDLSLSPKEKALKLSLKKAQALKTENLNDLIIGADQILVLKDQTLTKPLTKDNAFLQLKNLQGNTHSLFTAYTILVHDQQINYCDETILKMRPLTNLEISNYLDSEDVLDTVGSYKLEGLGISLFESIKSSDFNSIIGLPIMNLAKDLRFLGYQIP